MKRARLIPMATLAMLAATVPATAHMGAAGHTHGFLLGLFHPVGGPGHVLAMVTTGLLATRLGGIALWRVAAAFRAARR